MCLVREFFYSQISGNALFQAGRARPGWAGVVSRTLLTWYAQRGREGGKRGLEAPKIPEDGIGTGDVVLSLG